MFIYIFFAEMQLLTSTCENTNNCSINALCFLHIICAVNNYLHNNTNAYLLKIYRVMLLHNLFYPRIFFQILISVHVFYTLMDKSLQHHEKCTQKNCIPINVLNCIFIIILIQLQVEKQQKNITVLKT